MERQSPRAEVKGKARAVALFGRKAKSTSTAPSTPLSRSEPAPAPTIDYSDLAQVRNEWAGRLETPDDGMLGWRNGMSLYNQTPVPGQRLNVAEYMTRALAYHLIGPPLLDDGDAVETVRRVLTLVEAIPSDPPWMLQFAPPLSRLALAVCREKGWQATTLGGDGQVTGEILQARHDGPVWMSIQAPGVAQSDAMKHFFQ